MKENTYCVIVILWLSSALLPAQLNIDSKKESSSPRQIKSIQGSGIIKTETREVGLFNEISLKGLPDVNIVYGEIPRLTISADDNILPIILTEVKDGNLMISSNRGYGTRNPIKIEIEIPFIQKISFDGFGNVNLDSVTKNSLTIDIKGHGSITAIGSVNELVANIDGNGSLQLQKLKVGHCQITVKGFGDATLYVSEELDAKVDGNGKIFYSGNPEKITSKIEGFGQISPKE